MRMPAKFAEPPARSSVSAIRHPFRAARGAALFAMTMIISPAWAEYTVQQGDTIEIEVAGIPELKQRSTVQPDGAIAFPLVGALAVEGLTPAQLRSAVQTQLAKKIYRQRANDGREMLMVIQPDEVSAAIVAYRPIYVTGDVVKPGEQTFLPKMTVRQALALAGGTDINARFGRPTRDLSALKVDFELAWVDFASATARIARVAAELNGTSDLGKLDFPNGPLPKERLAEIEKSESAIFQARMADYLRERDFLKSTVDQADERIAVVEKQQAEEEQGSRADTLELKRLVELLSKGQETNPRVTDARRALLLSSTRALQVNVELLELSGGGQNEVCVPGSVGEELLAHDGEKIFSLEASDNLVLFGHNYHRIGVVDEQGFNGRIELVFVQEHRAEAPLIQHARSGLDPIRPHQLFPFDREGPNWQLQDAAANSAPRTDERRKTRGSAHRLAAACVAFDRDADTDHARLSGRVFSS